MDPPYLPCHISGGIAERQISLTGPENLILRLPKFTGKNEQILHIEEKKEM